MGIDYPLPESYKVKIASTPHVVAVVPDVFFGGIYHETCDQFPSIAMEPDQIDVMFPDWGFTGLSDFKKIKTACLAAQGTMRRFHLQVGQQIELRGTIYPFNVRLTIVGTIAKGPAPSFLIFRRDYFEDAAGRPGIVDNFWVRVDDSRVVPQVCAELDRQFANSSAETQSDSEEAFMGSILGRFRVFIRVAELLGLVVVVAIGLVAANSAAMSIRERRSEFAVMRSLGFPSSTLMTLLVSESVLLSLLSGMVGCGAAYGLLKTVSFNADALGPFVALRIPQTAIFTTMLVASLLGILSAYFPARSAIKQTIVDALRRID
jgi:putative ABC transport system permease protein